MAKIYEKVDDKTSALIQSVLIEHHDSLLAEKVTVGALFISDVDENGDEGPSLKHHGYPALAKIAVTPYVDRVRGLADCKLIIDRFEWKQLSKTRQQALIDHELTHLVVATDKEGLVKRDDLGRPKLKLRVHDFEVGWFTEVAERHGEAASEVRQMIQFQERWGQFCLFPLPGTEAKAK